VSCRAQRESRGLSGQQNKAAEVAPNTDNVHGAGSAMRFGVAKRASSCHVHSASDVESLSFHCWHSHGFGSPANMKSERKSGTMSAMAMLERLAWS
jgi:hypothetical protein